MWLDNKGNVSIVVALCLPMVIGGAAFGIEVGYWRYDQVRVQQAADVAAYAAAVVKRSDGAAATHDVLVSAATTAASCVSCSVRIPDSALAAFAMASTCSVTPLSASASAAIANSGSRMSRRRSSTWSGIGNSSARS